MKKHPVILSSNLPNRYGFRIDTKGIDLSLVNRNPVVLYMHLRANKENPKLRPVGKAMDFQINEKQELTANLVFNQKYEFAKEVEQDFEDGFLNTVSIKGEIMDIDPREALFFPGQTMPTVTKLLLEEISVVDIPGDSGASAIRLHYQGKEAIEVALSYDNEPDLSILFPTKPKKSDMKLIQLAFTGQKFVTLAKDATEEQIASAVSDLAAKANESADKVVILSAQVTEKDTLITSLQTQIKTVELQAVTDKATSLVDDAVTAKKITPAEKAEYVELAKTNFDTVKKILDNKKGFTSLTGSTELETGGVDYASLSYDELDKGNHMAKVKKERPEIYKAKFAEKFGRQPK